MTQYNFPVACSCTTATDGGRDATQTCYTHSLQCCHTHTRCEESQAVVKYPSSSVTHVFVFVWSKLLHFQSIIKFDSMALVWVIQNLNTSNNYATWIPINVITSSAQAAPLGGGLTTAAPLSLPLGWALIVSDSDVSTALSDSTVLSWLLSTQDLSWPRCHQYLPVTVTTTSRAVIGPACSDSLSVGSHNSWQMRLMIPCLLRPLWVLGETMGRCRPSSPCFSLNCISLHPPTSPRLHSHIYIWLKVVHHPPPHHSLLLSDGWRGGGINLGFMGTPLPLSTLSEIPVCLSDSSLLIVLCGCVWRVPLSEWPMIRANDAYWELLSNEERFVSSQLEAVSQTKRAGAMATSLKYMFDMRWQRTNVIDIANIQLWSCFFFFCDISTIIRLSPKSLIHYPVDTNRGHTETSEWMGGYADL